MAAAASGYRPDNARWIRVGLRLLVGTFCTALSLQVVLSDAASAGGLMSKLLWQRTVSLLGGRLSRVDAARADEDVSLILLYLMLLAGAAFCWVLGAWAISWRTKRSFREALLEWGIRGALCWYLPGVWVALWTATLLAGRDGAQSLLIITLPLWYSVTLAGWLATFCTMATPTRATSEIAAGLDDHRIAKRVLVAALLYVAVYTAMNWQLYRGLLVPHGDSAMYEEHLWNIEQGKGFRSYLDPGLFLGEHVQVIHLALIPLHFLWPSHLLLELCESAALASGAIPVFWMARRQTGSRRAGALLAFAYLLYFPMQFLDIAVDLKTFRPISFGVPLLLFALDRMERKKYWSMSVLLLCVLTAKEDYSVVIAPLGLWLLLRGGEKSTPYEEPQGTQSVGLKGGTRPVGFAGGMLVGGVGYLLLVLIVLIPAFRAGGDPHYTGYFSWLGDSPAEIARTATTQPAVWLARLFSARSFFSTLALLVPLGFLPLFSPGRLAVGLPLFAALCLVSISGGAANGADLPLVPFHHFHAPLVPILFWAAAAGLKNAGPACGRICEWLPHRVIETRFLRRNRVSADVTLSPTQCEGATTSTNRAAHFAWTSALAAGLFFSLSPLGIPFWDFGSNWYWQNLYVPHERAAKFPDVLALVPADSSVASTDFVHPRFTHHRESYDYSQYSRAVNDNKPGAPADTEYIVIDTQHPYSQIKRPEEIREFREEPDRWKLLLDDGFFIVLKRTD